MIQRFPRNCNIFCDLLDSLSWTPRSLRNKAATHYSREETIAAIIARRPSLLGAGIGMIVFVLYSGTDSDSKERERVRREKGKQISHRNEVKTQNSSFFFVSQV